MAIGPEWKLSFERAEAKMTTKSSSGLENGLDIVALDSGAFEYCFPMHTDTRGKLTAGEFPRDIPFNPLRYFIVNEVPTDEVRGEHAHLLCKQFLICVSGSCEVITDNGHAKSVTVLDRPNKGLLIPELIWGIQHKYANGGTLLVFASEHYDAGDYIRSYDGFLSVITQGG